MAYVNEHSKRSGPRAARVAAVAALTTLTALLSSPAAQALQRDDGDDPGSGLSVFQTLSLFVATPILLFAVIAGLVILSDRRR